MSEPNHGFAHRPISPATVLLIVKLHQRSMLQAQIARRVGESGARVCRVLARAGMSRRSELEPREPMQAHEHAAPGNLLQIDTKKLGCIEQPGHRVTVNRHVHSRGIAWYMLFVTIDDCARASPSRRCTPTRRRRGQRPSCAPQWPTTLGSLSPIKRPLTNNGSAFRSDDFADACKSLGIRHKFNPV